MMRRYARILAAQLRISFLRALQYRLDFALGLVMSAFWTATSVLPLFVLFETRASVGAWRRGDALLVAGFFTALKGVLAGFVQPSLVTVVDHVRKGTLDQVLLKPADAEFLVSTSRLEPWRATDLFGAAALFAWALHDLGARPSVAQWALSGLLFLGATVILHALWLTVVTVSFVMVKVDNLQFFMQSLLDLARWPSSVFRGALSVVFTFVFPVTLMTSAPALALRGTLDARHTFLALATAVWMSLASRWIFGRALRRYASAG